MKFSVIIPTFNRRRQIGEAVASALAQADTEVEVFVVDDGSSDGTVDWLLAEHADPRLRVLANARSKGPAGARNTGLLAATGDFVALLDSDDLFLDRHLAECREVFSRFPGVDVVFGRAIYEEDGKEVDYMGPNFERKLGQAPALHQDETVAVFSPDFFTHLLRQGCYFNLSTVVLRAPVAGLMREELRIAEDYEYWVRLARRHAFACLKRPQIRYRLHGENISFAAAGSAAEHGPQLLQAYRFMLDYPGLEPFQVRLIRERLAEVLFDWGYRCRRQRRFGEAGRRHLQSFLYGWRRRNTLALLKLPLLGLFPGLEAGHR